MARDRNNHRRAERRSGRERRHDFTRARLAAERRNYIADRRA